MLRRILEFKRLEVEKRKRERPLREVMAAAGEAGPVRDFVGALRRNGGPVRMIAELKKASPSRGLLCPSFSVDRLAEAYTVSGAAALSVLTDRNFFQGDLKFIAQAKRVSPLPVLRKDFMVDPYQVYEAQEAGADAILLIAAALSPGMLKELAVLGRRLGLATLVEVHGEEELERVLDCQVSAIGINNRDLATFETDLAVTERLAKLVPAGVPVVSESGLKSGADVRRVAAAGVEAILVGEALVTSTDIPGTVRELMGQLTETAL